MKIILKILILVILASKAFGQDSEKLYPIPKGNLWGYIDATGKTVIKPCFISAGSFSEGLAPVRLNGTYGYIDRTGKFTIPPKYDFALSFDHGLAKVFIEGKTFFIDNGGNILFQHDYKSISLFGSNSYAIVITETDKFGVINKSGKLLIDTVFALIHEFTNGIAVVTGLNHRPYQRDSTEKIIFEKGVIDSLGNWIVKYGEYEDIGEFKNGYAQVELNVKRQKGYYDYKGIIDEKGKYRFTVPSKKWHFDYSNDHFNQDIAHVEIYSVDPDSLRVRSSKKKYDYKGAINSNGEILFSNSDWEELTPFTLNRAFAKEKGGKWYMIDTHGKQVTSESFTDIIYENEMEKVPSFFQNGKAFVKTAKGWGAIDTTGTFVIEPNDLKSFEYDQLIRRGDIIFLEEDISDENDKYSYRYGFWNTTNNVIIKPQFHDIDLSGFEDEIIYVMKYDHFGYVNEDGNEVWKGDNEAYSEQLNIDYMNRGYYYASSKYKKELAGFGGWGGSDNGSKKISSNVRFLPNTFQIKIDPNQKTKWSEKYDAVKLYVANTSNDTLYFNAQDSRLYLKIQAQDRNGNWKDIEYLPGSWCGNSYHSLFLAPDELWEFKTPVYQGEFKTKLRAQLFYMKSKEQKEDDIIYSNEIEGYVNPGQFWNKREYHPNGLMDPYFD